MAACHTPCCSSLQQSVGQQNPGCIMECYMQRHTLQPLDKRRKQQLNDSVTYP